MCCIQRFARALSELHDTKAPSPVYHVDGVSYNGDIGEAEEGVGFC